MWVKIDIFVSVVFWLFVIWIEVILFFFRFCFKEIVICCLLFKNWYVDRFEYVKEFILLVINIVFRNSFEKI